MWKNGEATAFRPPGYPFFLSLLYRIFSDPLAGKVANALLLTASATLMCRIVGNSLPALFVLAYPVLLYTAGTLYPQILGGFLLLLLLTLLTAIKARPKLLLPAGLVLGFLILCIPAFLLTSPVFALLVFRQGSGPIHSRLLRVAGLTVFTFFVVAPWTWRNYQTFGAVIPVSTNSGPKLFLGNSAHAGPNTGVNVPKGPESAATSELNEVETDRYYRDEALEWIGENPLKALRLYAAKCLNYFNFRNELYVASQSSSLKDLVMLGTWGPLLLLFFGRLFFLRKFPLSPLEASIYLLVISNVLLSAIFFTRIRFRLPFDMLMILANANFVTRALSETSWLRGLRRFRPIWSTASRA